MFISRDPIGLMGGDNVFAYAPNPTGFVDPLGLRGVDNLIKLAGADAAIDLAVPEPTNAFWPKLVVEVGVVGLAAAYEANQSKTKAIPQSQANINKSSENECTATISSYAAQRLASKTANPNFKPNMVIQGSQPIARRGTKGYEQFMYRVPNTTNITNTNSYVILSHHPIDSKHNCPHWHVGYSKELKRNTNTFFSNSPYLPITTGTGSWQYRKDGLPAVEHKIEP